MLFARGKGKGEAFGFLRLKNQESTPQRQTILALE